MSLDHTVWFKTYNIENMIQKLVIAKISFIIKSSIRYNGGMNSKDLVGTWQISRTIMGGNGSLKGFMNGTGQFDFCGEEELIYQEKLCHQTEKAERFFATKFYRYHFSEDGIAIYFHREENNRLFMTLEKETLKGHSACKADRYGLKWEWMSARRFLTRYKVIGPKKDYVIESEFCR